MSRVRRAFVTAGVMCVVAGGCMESPQEPESGRSAAVVAHGGDGALAGGGNAGIVLPATGSAEDNNTFKGTLTLLGAGFDEQVGPTVRVQASGVLVGASSSDESQPGETVSITFAPVDMSYQQIDADDDCIELKISPPAAFDAQTKTTVEFDVSVVATRSLPGPANLIADLICANDRIARYQWEGGSTAARSTAVPGVATTRR